jgi:hypothetical protein
MLKIAICDDNEVQLTIIQEELEKNIKEKQIQPRLNNIYFPSTLE